MVILYFGIIQRSVEMQIVLLARLKPILWTWWESTRGNRLHRHYFNSCASCFMYSFIGLKYLNNSELRQREPYVSSHKTLLVPEEGIVDYIGVMMSLKDKIINSGGDVFLNKKIKKIEERKNLIYIDGNHDYEVVKSDFELSMKNLSNDGFIVIDDSSLYFDFQQKKYGGFTGHPGPSKVAKDIAMEKTRFFGAVGHNNIFYDETSLTLILTLIHPYSSTPHTHTHTHKHTRIP